MAESEKITLIKKLVAEGQSKSEVARLLNVSRQYIHRVCGTYEAFRGPVENSAIDTPIDHDTVGDVIQRSA